MSDATQPSAPAAAEEEPPVSLPFTAAELRSLAEYASSIRGKDAYFVRGNHGWEEHTDPKNIVGGLIIHVRNAGLPARPQVFSGNLKAKKGTGPETEVNLMAVPDPREPKTKTVAADAVFWSQSAVEKFLVPYYASVYGNQADVAIGNLLDVLDSPRAGKKGDAPIAYDEAFALAHIPRSEYVTVSGGVVILAHGPDGVESLTLEEHARRLREGQEP